MLIRYVLLCIQSATVELSVSLVFCELYSDQYVVALVIE